MQLWNNFAAKHPAAAKWVREGGLFVIVSNLVTVFKYLLLQFLPAAFSSLPVVDFGWPGIPVTLFGETFQWNILGYDSAHGGLPYFCAYMVAMVVGECINFPIQRNFVFRSKGNLAKQMGIKPGSREFHALKNGAVGTYDRWGYPIRIDQRVSVDWSKRGPGQGKGGGKPAQAGSAKPDHAGHGQGNSGRGPGNSGKGNSGKGNGKGNGRD